MRRTRAPSRGDPALSPIRPRPTLRSTAVLASLAIAAATVAVASAARASSEPVDPALPDASWRLIGPYRAGWATVVAGVPGDPATFYFGSAGGGVWKTTDAGRTWQPTMQHERAAAIGALAVAASDPRILVAGTGQPDSRYDIMPGAGVYRSTDAGESWRAIGLADTRHIGDILIHPEDPDRILVAALGHVFGPGPERGVYLTADAGRHWRAVLALPDSVGAVDLAWDPAAPRTVFVATWQLRLHPWFDYFLPQGGPGSGVWRSDDGGEHWSRVGEGLPAGRLGRIGLAVAPGSAGRVVLACVQVSGAGADGAAPGRSGLYRSDDAGAHWRLVNPDGGLGSSYFGRIVFAPHDTATVYATGLSLRVSHDGGRHFAVMRGSPGGDDYHALWIDPTDPRRMITGSDQGAAVTLNGGLTWSSWYNQPTGQFYHLAADERFPYHVYSGQQDNGTVEIASRGPYGAIEERDWHPVGGDERDDMVPKPGDPRIVFGSGLGGTVSRFDAETRQSADVSPWPVDAYGADPATVRYRSGWLAPLEVSPLPPHAVYLGAQCLFRSFDDGRHWDIVSPDLSGSDPARAPCHGESPADARACGYGVISSIAPSPLDTAVVWVGTDDGKVRRTRDGGAHWDDLTPPAAPVWGIVSAISLSRRDPSVAYVAYDTHRLDRHQPVAFRTRDGGRIWTSISAGLPRDEFVAVVRCDREQPGLLYAGTDRSVYVSLDDGAHWRRIARGLPTAWVRDLLPHHDDLVVATQGRGIWIYDDIAPLRELAAGRTDATLELFTPPVAVRLRASESHDTPPPPETPLGRNPPTGAILDYRLGAGVTGPVTLTITDPRGRVVRRFRSDDRPESLGVRAYFEDAWLGTPATLAAGPGMHRFVWDLREPRPAARSFHHSIAAIRGEGTPVRPEGAFVVPGRYTVTLSAAGRSRSRPLEVRLDPRLLVPAAELEAQHALSHAIDSTLAAVWSAHDAIAASRAAAGSALAPALAESLTAIADGPAGLTHVAGMLTRLATSVQEADTGPTDGQRAVYDLCAPAADGLLARWRRLAPAVPAPSRPPAR